MNKKLLIGIIVGLVVATAFVGPPLPMGVAIAAWVYLVWIVWRKKTKIFSGQMEPKLAERLLKWLKASILVAGISLMVGIVSFIVGVIILGYEEEAAIFYIIFYIALFSVLLFIIGNVSGLVIILKGRRKPR
jgi:hypothetical protein